MRVLVACEFSGRVRDAFIKRGHDATSCDILPTEKPGPHFQCDIREVDITGFDRKIAFPPCTRLCRSGQHWIKRRGLYKEREEAIEFFMWFVEHGFNCIENPVGIMSTLYRKPDQYFQPWQFGHPDNKKTCLWLNGVLPLTDTNNLGGGHDTILAMSQSKDRAKLRSLTYTGVAKAMAEQWG